VDKTLVSGQNILFYFCLVYLGQESEFNSACPKMAI